MWHVWGEGKYIQNFGTGTNGKRTLGRLRIRCDNDIKMYVKLIK